MNMHLIAIRCVDECRRQKVGLAELAGLISAYQYAASNARFDRLPTVDDLVMISGRIEPVNKHRGFRQIPVTFANGGSAIDWQDIPDNLRIMFDMLDYDTPVDQWIKSLLDVHPFEDGNGRTAFVLYNWINETLDEPVPLPDFYRDRLTI